MAFPTRPTAGYEKVGAGERHGTNVVILSHERWQDGLVIGRFAHYNAADDRIENMAGVDSPVVAGVVLRDVSNPVDAENDNDRAVYRWPDRGRMAVDATCDGLVTVRVLPGDSPAKFARVYAVNADDDTAGMATTDDEAVPTGAIFIREEKPGVWLIRDRRDPQDVPAPEPVVYSISPDNPSGEVGDTIQFTLTADGEPVTGPLSWTVPADSGLTITNDGLLAIVSADPGDYAIGVTGFDATTTLTVTGE